MSNDNSKTEKMVTRMIIDHEGMTPKKNRVRRLPSA